jgi:hypothetical protein
MSYVLSSIPSKAAYQIPSNAAHQWAAHLPPEPVHVGRLLIAFCIGIVATLAWQSYGDAAREKIANSSPRLSWLATSAVRVSQADAAAFSPDRKELNAISIGLTGLQQRIDQIAAAQEQMAEDITNRLQTVEQDIADKISTPPAQAAAVPALKPPSRPSPPEGPRPGR